ncbi:hypothetical protein D3C80_2216100 [compost metagenome]
MEGPVGCVDHIFEQGVGILQPKLVAKTDEERHDEPHNPAFHFAIDLLLNQLFPVFAAFGDVVEHRIKH